MIIWSISSIALRIKLADEAKEVIGVELNLILVHPHQPQRATWVLEG